MRSWVLCVVQAAENQASSLQKEVDKAADHIAKLAEKVKKAEAGQAEAQHKLASAGVEASTARKLVEAVRISHSHPLYHVWGPRPVGDKDRGGGRGRGRWQGSLCNRWACACSIDFAHTCNLMHV